MIVLICSQYNVFLPQELDQRTLITIWDQKSPTILVWIMVLNIEFNLAYHVYDMWQCGYLVGGCNVTSGPAARLNHFEEAEGSSLVCKGPKPSWKIHMRLIAMVCDGSNIFLQKSLFCHMKVKRWENWHLVYFYERAVHHLCCLLTCSMMEKWLHIRIAE